MKFIDELKQRNVIRVAAAYIVIAWVLLQGVDFVLEIIVAPDWVLQVFVLVSVIGLPVVVIFSWIFEITPEGIKLESEIDHSQPLAQGAGQKLDRTIIIFLVLAVGLLLVNRNMGTGELLLTNDERPATEQTDASDQIELPESPEFDRSVAVLPFVNMSSDPEQEYFSDGLTEELLNKLTQYRRLRVAARTSSFQFKDKNEDISIVAEKLKVAYVLEGSVRKSGDKIRITAQLIQASDGFQVWSHTFERQMDDIFAIQDDISSAIISELEVEFGAVPHEAAERPTQSLPAYQLFLQARFYLAKRSGEHLLKAMDLFRQAIDLDPDFTNAWSGLAFTYGILPLYSTALSSEELEIKASEAAEKALQLDPQNAEAFAALGRIQDRFTNQKVAAQDSYKRAMELAPNNAEVANLYGDYFVGIGDFDYAERMERKAVELDPLSAINYSDLAFLYIITHRLDLALTNARIATELNPDSFEMQDKLIVALILSGDFEGASKVIIHARDELNADPGYVSSWWLLYYYHQGDRDNLRKTLDLHLQLENEGDVYFVHVTGAFYTLALDGVAAALPLLDKSWKDRELLLTWPDYFYLPERYSDNPEWLEFWQQPNLKETMELRRQFGPYESIGFWKGPLE